MNKDELRELQKREKGFVGRAARILIGTAKTMVAPMTLSRMLAAGRYDWVNPDIAEQSLLTKPELFTAKGSKLFDFSHRFMIRAQIEMAIRKEGYEPDPIEKVLAYGAENPEEQREYSIFALGSSLVNFRSEPSIPYLGGSIRERYVHLFCDFPEVLWCGPFRFLASPKVQS